MDDATRARLEDHWAWLLDGTQTPGDALLAADLRALLAAYDAQAPIVQAAAALLRPCRNCGQCATRSLCARCRAYQRRTGRPRPPASASLISEGSPRAGLLCRICRDRPVWACGRCGRCYQYWHRTGHDRVLAASEGIAHAP